MNAVAKNLKRLRTARSMTQDELAEKLHVTRQTVSNWELGKNQPDIDTLDTLASVFETDINELIYGSMKNAYPKYQKRFVKAVIITASVLIILTALRLTLIPYLTALKAKTFNFGFELIIFNFVSMAAIFFCLGFCVLSVFSLWFDCSPRRSTLYILSAMIGIAPVVLLLCEYILWKFVSDKTPANLLAAMMLRRWLRPVFTQILPAAAGVSVFLNRNMIKK